MLLYKHCTFTRRSKSKKGIVWKCTASKTDDCKVFITTDDYLNVVLKKGKHTHKKPSSNTTPKHIYFTCETESKTKKAVTSKPTKTTDDKPKTPKKVKQGKSEKTPKKKSPKVKTNAESDDIESKERQILEDITPSPKKSTNKKKTPEKSKKDRSLDYEDQFKVKSPKKAKSTSETTENYDVDFKLVKSKSSL